MKDIHIFYNKSHKDSKHILEKFPRAIPVKSIEDCATTNYCWFIDKNVFLDKNFNIEYELQSWDEVYIHQFTNQDQQGLYLIPYRAKIEKDIHGQLKNTKNIKTTGWFYQRPEYDIFYLSCGENFADTNYEKIKERFPFVKRVKDIKGIYAAHKIAALKSTTPYFWVLDADNYPIDTFNFNYKVLPSEFDVIHIWHSVNDINGLEYGNGGIKLLPKFIFNIERKLETDITTSLSDQIKIINQVASINHIGQSPFYAWRSAFREAAKLTARLHIQPNDTETVERLKTWKFKGHDKQPFGSFAVLGAKAGNKFAAENAAMMLKINDYGWLYEQFKLAFPKLQIKH